MILPTQISENDRLFTNKLEDYLHIMFPHIVANNNNARVATYNAINLKEYTSHFSDYQRLMRDGGSTGHLTNSNFMYSALCRVVNNDSNDELYTRFLNNYVLNNSLTSRMRELLKKNHVYVDKSYNIVMTIPTDKFRLIETERIAYICLLQALMFSIPSKPKAIIDALVNMIRNFGDEDTMIKSIKTISENTNNDTIFNNLNVHFRAHKYEHLLHGYADALSLEASVRNYYSKYLEALGWLKVYKDTISNYNDDEANTVKEIITRATSCGITPNFAANGYLYLSANLPLTNCDPKELTTYQKIVEQGLAKIKEGNTRLTSSEEMWTVRERASLIRLLSDSKNYQLYTYTSIRIDIASWNIRSDSDRAMFAGTTMDVLRQPHIMHYNCFNSTIASASAAFKEGKYMIGMMYLKNSMQQLTLSDSTVVSRLLGDLDHDYLHPIKRLSDGKMLTWREYINETA